MTRWEYEINIKQHLTEDDPTWENLCKVANGISKEFKKLPSKLIEDNFQVQDDLEFFEELNPDDTEWLVEVYESPEELQSEINYRLNSLYDFCDYHRVWCGL